MTLETYATLIAHVDHFPREVRAEVLERLGRPAADDWEKVTLEGNECVLAAMKADDDAAIERFALRIGEVKKELESKHKKLEDLGPRRSKAPPPFPAPPPEEPSPPAPASLLSAVADLPPPREITLAAPERAGISEEVRPRPVPTSQATLTGPLDAHLSAPPRQAAPLPTPPPAEATLPLPGPPAAPRGSGTRPRLSLQRYALMRAEIANSVDAAAAAEIRTSYGLDEARDAAEQAAWNERFQDRRVLEEYTAMFQRFLARLRVSRR